jgi:hypothetical protein
MKRFRLSTFLLTSFGMVVGIALASHFDGVPLSNATDNICFAILGAALASVKRNGD